MASQALTLLALALALALSMQGTLGNIECENLDKDSCAYADDDRDIVGFAFGTAFCRKLCSKECYGNCPNIVDLYFNLAAGEGVYLPKLCEAQGANVRREMTEIKSSGYVTPAPESPQYVNGVNFLYAPSMAPF
ncbi:hypothetical protein DH2020_009945 [Rehmannia glutinosa]|uniref:Uncharacterized protein n=1 Tax=Rehmannia glutinosa TaxID=99300 RepID=A0ABR0X9R7_REHGL